MGRPSSGIGRALVEQYTKLGAQYIVLASRSRDKMESIVAQLAPAHPTTKFLVIPADLSSEKACADLIQQALAAMDGIDVLVLNHITDSRFGFFSDTVAKEGVSFVRKMFEANTLSYIYLTTYIPSSSLVFCSIFCKLIYCRQFSRV